MLPGPHDALKMRPRIQGEGNQGAGAGDVMFESAAPCRGQGSSVAMQMPHQVAFPIFRHPIAEHEVMHAPGDVDRIDLDVSVMGEGSAYTSRRLIEQERTAHKPAGGEGIDD